MTSIARAALLPAAALAACSPLGSSTGDVDTELELAPTVGNAVKPVIRNTLAVDIGARRWHTATLLPSGTYGDKILIVGGADGSLLPAAAVVGVLDPNPGNETWTVISGGPGQEIPGRYLHTATFVKGRTAAEDLVLIIGGYGADQERLDDVWAFELSGGGLRLEGSLQKPRAEHTALDIGSPSEPQILVVGGDEADSTHVEPRLRDAGTSEVGTYNVLSVLGWAPGPELNGPRFGHTATVAGSDGQVLIVGGSPDYLGTPASATELSSIEVIAVTALDAQNASSISDPDLKPRGPHAHAASWLPDSGRLLMVGSNGGALPQLFNPRTREVTDAGTPNLSRGYPKTLDLETGDAVDRVLVVGGMVGSNAELGKDVEFFVSDGSVRAWERSTVKLDTGRVGHTATGFADGRRAAIAGGRLGRGPVLGTVEVFGIVPNGASCEDDEDCVSGHCILAGICCNEPCAEDEGSCETCFEAEGAPEDGTCAPRDDGFVCGPPLDACDAAEMCVGSRTCPTDRRLPEDAECDDGDPTTAQSACHSDVCQGTTEPVGGQAGSGGERGGAGGGGGGGGSGGEGGEAGGDGGHSAGGDSIGTTGGAPGEGGSAPMQAGMDDGGEATAGAIADPSTESDLRTPFSCSVGSPSRDELFTIASLFAMLSLARVARRRGRAR